MDDETTTTTDAPELAKAPEDAKTGEATGYALYDRTIGQYVGPVIHGRQQPARDKFPEGVEGHDYEIVRV